MYHLVINFHKCLVQIYIMYLDNKIPVLLFKLFSEGSNMMGIYSNRSF